jgi:hypothetical protein
MARQSAEKWLVADLRQVVFRQTGHFHHGTAVNAVLQHGTGNFRVASRSPSERPFSIPRFSQLDACSIPCSIPCWIPFNTFLLELLCDGHECVSVLRHTLCQFAYKGFGVGCHLPALYSVPVI